MVFSFESLICTFMNIGCVIRPKLRKTTKAIGSTGRITSISLKFVMSRMSSAETSRTSDCVVIKQPLADEHAHLFDVVRGPDHQLAGLVAVVVAEREPLDLR